MTRSSRCSALLSAAALVAVAATGRAQTCAPATNSNEAKIFGNRSLALAFGRGAPIAIDQPWTVHAGVELVMLPHISDATATPTACRPGKGPENVNALPGIARIGASIALPGHFSVAANWLPPVPVKDMTGNALGLALGYDRAVSRALGIGARIYTTLGHVTGPITCPDKELTDANSECFQGTRSSDRFEPGIYGGDVAIGSAAADARFAWYAGVGYEQLKPRFQVHFRNQAGELDTTRVEVDLNRATGFAGIAWSLGKRWRATGELFGTPDDGVTARLVLSASLAPRS